MDKIQPPKTIEEVGIHLMYMSQKIDDLVKKDYVTGETYSTDQKITNDRLKKLEASDLDTKLFHQKWASRVWGINTTIGVVISALALIISYLFPHQSQPQQPQPQQSSISISK